MPEKNVTRVIKPQKAPAPQAGKTPSGRTPAIERLQRQIGNRAIQRMLNKPCTDCPEEPDANIGERVNREINRTSHHPPAI